MIRLQSKGDFKKSRKFLNTILSGNYLRVLDKYGQIGVDALASATPTRTGLTASSWTYKTRISGDSAEIVWSNTNVNKGVNIALILQYGHGTGTGGYVQGRDYINPAIQPVFDEIAEKVWKEVTRA